MVDSQLLEMHVVCAASSGGAATREKVAYKDQAAVRFAADWNRPFGLPDPVRWRLKVVKFVPAWDDPGVRHAYPDKQASLHTAVR